MALTRGLRDLAELLHLPAVAFVVLAASVFVRVLEDGGTGKPSQILFVASVLATQLSIALHNNWCDRAADAITKPWRVMPRGVVGPGTVLSSALGLLALGLVLAWMLGPVVLLLVAAGTAAGFVYNAWLKRTPWSWAPFAFALPTLAVCSMAVSGRLEGLPFQLYLIGAPLVLAIHLADSVPDIEGDRATGSRGLAVALGRKPALLACWSGLLAAIVLSIVLRPPGLPAGPLVAVALVLIIAAVLASGRSLQAHRILVFFSAVAVSIDHVAALAA